ncbi:anhydro-N-acetylmuramic acid kinase [Pelagibacteraceae bacterium]|nr:anhydro-N-acetylmuramic acid kinase [Pelagibacteraceae bacterium]
MQKKYTSLGLMSGTSGDGVDASILFSNGMDQFEVIKDKYFEYDQNIYKNFHTLKEAIYSLKDLKKYSKEILDLEKKITLFHAKIIKDISENRTIDLIGFHGQTIYHNSREKISNQLGNGKLLYQLTKRKIIYNFRENDINNGGEGAPLTPIFHQLIVDKVKLDLPIIILNIGGISNATYITSYSDTSGISSRDIGPGNCMIDSWIRKNSKNKFDIDGKLASLGNRNNLIYEQALELFGNRMIEEKSLSLDVNNFDISFIRGLSLEDGAATITDLTAKIIGTSLSVNATKIKNKIWKVLVCGGGRKNKFFMKKIKENLSKNLVIQSIDDYGLDGDFIESQAFAFLAIRSFLKLPISFPQTTGCLNSCSGGELVKN